MVTDLIHDLIGCTWGRSVWTDDDPDACPDRAASITVVHDQGKQIELKLCPKHKSRILEETAPHAHAPDPDVLPVVVLECEECGHAVACKAGEEPPSSCASHS